MRWNIQRAPSQPLVPSLARVRMTESLAEAHVGHVAVTDEALREPQVRFIDAAHCYSMVHRDCASRMDAIASSAESHGTLVHAIHAACSYGTYRTRC